MPSDVRSDANLQCACCPGGRKPSGWLFAGAGHRVEGRSAQRRDRREDRVAGSVRHRPPPRRRETD